MNDDQTGQQMNSILVVDDTTANLQLLTNLLTTQGYTVYPASDGELALRFVSSTLPHLILLDIQMPGMDGLEVCRRLKADERTSAIPVIFISILEYERDKVKGFHAGAVDYITKPFQAEEVLARVRIHLQLRELSERLEQKVIERTEALRSANEQLERELAERKNAEAALRQSETLLNATQRLAQTGGWQWDVEQQTGFWTDETYRIHGLERTASTPGFTEAIERSLACYDAIDRPIISAAFERCVQQGESYDLEFPFTSADGSRKWIRTTATAVREHGRIARVVGNIMDITQRKKADEALRKSEAKYRTLFENVNEGFALHEIIVDESGVPGDYRFLEINPAFESITGLERAKVLGRTAREVLPGIEKDPADWIGKYGRVALTREGVSFENFSEQIGRWYHVSAFSPKAGFFAVTFTDITERKAAEEAQHRLHEELDRRVLERTAELEGAKKELESFTYSVSHDLRAPLRHIHGFLELLLKEVGEDTGDQGLHYMGQILTAAEKMGRLIDELLAFSRMSRHALSIRAVVLGDLVREVLRDVQSDTADRDIQWQIGEMPVVQGDRVMLRTALESLISNAVKFTQTRDEARIEIGSQPGQGVEDVVFVRDNGVGFDMAYEEKLFGVFQRLHREEEFEGTGIGLAHVRRIIARHGGRVWAEGRLDEGAVFYFSLPRAVQREGMNGGAIEAFDRHRNAASEKV